MYVYYARTIYTYVIYACRLHYACYGMYVCYVYTYVLHAPDAFMCRMHVCLLCWFYVCYVMHVGYVLMLWYGMSVMYVMCVRYTCTHVVQICTLCM